MIIIDFVLIDAECFDRGEKFAHLYFKCFGDAYYIDGSNVALSAFNAAHISSIKSRFIRKAFLRKSLGFTQFAYFMTNLNKGWMFSFHPVRILALYLTIHGL